MDAVGVGIERREARDAAVAERIEKQRRRQDEDAPFDQPAFVVVMLVVLQFGRQTPRDDRHDHVERRGLEAERAPAVVEHPEPDRRRDRDGGDRREAPVGDAFRAPALGQHVGHVGRRSRQQPGPEHAVDEHQRQQDFVAWNERVGD
jgi:hypothetical protein